MAHAVEQLLTAAASAVTGLATTGTNVSTDRPDEYALQAAELPGLRVYDDGDAAENYGYLDGVDVYARTVRLRFEAAAKQSSGYTATLRQVAAEVEAALGGHLTVGGKQVRCWYRGSEMSTGAAGEQPVGVRRMTFEAVIYTAANAPTTLL